MDATQTMTQLRARRREALEALHAPVAPLSQEEAARRRERLDSIVGEIDAHSHAVSEDGHSATCVQCGQHWAAHALINQHDSVCLATYRATNSSPQATPTHPDDPATASAGDRSAWTLSGISLRDDTCEHCGRVLSRVFIVTHASGQVYRRGQVCARKVTGWSWQVALAERIQRVRDLDVAAQREHPHAWAQVDTEMQRAQGVRRRALDQGDWATRQAAETVITTLGEAITALRDSVRYPDHAAGQQDPTPFIRRALASAQKTLTALT